MTRLSGQVPSWIKMVAPSGSLEVTWGTNLFGNNSIFIFFNMVTVATFIIFRLSWGKRCWPLCHHQFHYYHNCLSHSRYLISCSGWVEGRGTILFVIIIFILIMMTYNLFHNIPIIISQHRKLVPADQSQFTSRNSVILISTSIQVILISTCWQHSAQTNQEILLTNHISELCHPHSSTSWLQSANTDPFSRKWDPLRLVLIVICNLCNPFLEECEARQMFVHTKHKLLKHGLSSLLKQGLSFSLLKQGLSFFFVETWVLNIWVLANWIF